MEPMMSKEVLNFDGLDHLLPNNHAKEGPLKDSRPLSSEMEAVDPEFSALYNERVDILRSYLMLAENPIDLQDENYRRTIFAKLSYGMRKAGEYLGQAKYHQRMAYARRKQAEAIAALDEFGKYLAQGKADGKDIKPTVDIRAHYVNIDPGVMAASAKEAYIDAIIEQLSTMKMEFMMAISTIKAVAYGIKDSDYMSSASVAVNSQQ
jgi:hypothetical protein